MIARQPVLLPAYAEEVLSGLKSRPKHLPCKLFYDERGSELFEQITQLPEYYPTRTELSILEAYASDIVQAAGTPISIVELGAGTAAKTGTLLRAVARRQMRVKYYPADISPSALAEAQRRVRGEFPGALVKPVIVDFADGFSFLRQISGRKLVLYLGSSIGNFDWNAATTMLRQVREQLSPADGLLLGTDMVKPAEVLVPAYDDSQGVTADFNKNILRRLNRDFKADFDLDSFNHIAKWNASQSRMEIFLESRRDQVVHLGMTGTKVRFAAGELMHTENSHKYTVDSIDTMLCVSGFRLEQSWFDPFKWFGLHLARA